MSGVEFITVNLGNRGISALPYSLYNLPALDLDVRHTFRKHSDFTLHALIPCMNNDGIQLCFTNQIPSSEFPHISALIRPAQLVQNLIIDDEWVMRIAGKAPR